MWQSYKRHRKVKLQRKLDEWSWCLCRVEMAYFFLRIESFSLLFLFLFLPRNAFELRIFSSFFRRHRRVFFFGVNIRRWNENCSNFAMCTLRRHKRIRMLPFRSPSCLPNDSSDEFYFDAREMTRRTSGSGFYGGRRIQSKHSAFKHYSLAGAENARKHKKEAFSYWDCDVDG